MRNILAGSICVLLGVASAWIMGPTLWADLLVNRDRLEPAPHYAVTEASCRTKAFVLTSCDLEFVHRETGEKVDRDFFAFGDFSGQPVTPLQAPEGGHVTSAISLDALWTRIFTLLLMSGFLTASGLYCLLARPGEPRKRRVKGGGRGKGRSG